MHMLRNTTQRQRFVDYTVSLHDSMSKWVSKAPSKSTSATNLLGIFDKTSWILTIASMLLVSFALIATYYIGSEKPDIVLLILRPLAMFNAEAMPVRVETASLRKTRGEFSRNFVFLNWSVLGMILVFCFLCKPKSNDA